MLPSDKPDEHIIEDDEELDRWYTNYTREMAIKSGKKNVQADFAGVPEFKG
jgi:hypothetical protein